MQMALPSGTYDEKHAGRKGSVAGFHVTLSIPFRMPTYLLATSGLARVLCRNPAPPPLSVSLAYVGDTVVTADE